MEIAAPPQEPPVPLPYREPPAPGASDAPDVLDARVVRNGWAAAGLALLSGVLYFLGFAGFELWPLSLVSLVPLLVALRGRRGFAVVGLGWLMGTVTNAGGFHWIVTLLRTFSGFPTVLCVAFALLLWAAQGFEFALFAWLVARADRARVSRLLSVPAALAALELTYPLLFPSYTANSLHAVAPLVQIADLGGPILVGALMALTHAALEHALIGQGPRPAPLRRRARALALPLALWACTLGYGLFRIAEVDRESAAAPALRVGIVQESLGLNENTDDPRVALARHLEATERLEQRGIDLAVWAEGVVPFAVPPGTRNVHQTLPWTLHTPVLFGTVTARGDQLFNTAVLVDGQGNVLGDYDKTYLLAFGEYLPLGETFPKIYEWSPNSGHLTPGNRMVSLPLPGSTPAAPRTIAPFICYEDILPRFTLNFQRRTHASLFAVILNDAWFGDTAEPWIHLALSQFRAIEHRRDFLRASNSGVSGFVDAAGRLVAHTGTFRREAIVGTVHLRTRSTVYDALGDWPGWLGLAVSLWMAAGAWRPRRARVSGVG